MDEERDVVAVDAPDHLDRAGDALDGRQVGDHRAEQALEALLGRGDELEQPLERRGRVDRRLRLRVDEPEHLERRHHPRVGARVLPQRHVGLAEAAGKHWCGHAGPSSGPLGERPAPDCRRRQGRRRTAAAPARRGQPGRTFLAMADSTPLTNRPESSVQKRLASSTASSSTTAVGTSSLASSS